MARAIRFGATRPINLILPSDAPPAPGELLATAYTREVGHSRQQIQGLIRQTKADLGSLLGGIPAPSVLQGWSVSAAGLLGPGGPLIASAGGWVASVVLGSLFGGYDTGPTDRQLFAGAGWVRLEPAPKAITARMVNQHGWMLGGRFTGELWASLGAVLGVQGFPLLSSTPGAELWLTPGGNYFLIVGSQSPTAIEAIKSRTGIDRWWMDTEVFAVDLAEGTIHQNGRDAIMSDAMKGQQANRLDLALQNWWLIPAPKRKQLLGKPGQVWMGKGWPTDSSLPPGAESVNLPRWYWPHHDPYVAQKHGRTMYSQAKSITWHPRQVVGTLRGLGIAPWRLDRMDYAIHAGRGLGYLLGWPPGLDKWLYSWPVAHYGESVAAAGQGGAVPATGIFGNYLAPWEPTDGRPHGMRIEERSSMIARWARFGPAAPRWSSRGVSGLLTNPLRDNHAPILDVVPGAAQYATAAAINASPAPGAPALKDQAHTQPKRVIAQLLAKGDPDSAPFGGFADHPEHLAGLALVAAALWSAR